jgi:hypothetical protein
LPEPQIEPTAFILIDALKKAEVYFTETMELTWCQDKKIPHQAAKNVKSYEDRPYYKVAYKAFRDRESVSGWMQVFT